MKKIALLAAGLALTACVTPRSVETVLDYSRDAVFTTHHREQRDNALYDTFFVQGLFQGKNYNMGQVFRLPIRRDLLRSLNDSVTVYNTNDTIRHAARETVQIAPALAAPAN